MAVKHEKYPVEGIQFHPESIRTSFGLELFSNFISKYVQQNKPPVNGSKEIS